MQFRFSFHLFVVAVALWCCGCEQPPPESTTQYPLGQLEAPIQGGYVDDFDTAVVGLVMLDGFGVASCSGTLISPNLVLTAQHCVAPIQGPEQGVDCAASTFGKSHAASSFWVTTHVEMVYDQNAYTGSAEVIIPVGGYGASWGQNDLVCGRDVALVRLAQPIDPSVATPMVPRVDSPLTTGEESSAIGYGATGQSGYGSGKRRRRDDLYVGCVGVECPSFYVKESEWVGDTGVCQGDSGGPAIDLYDRVIGVASRGGFGCSSPVYGGVYQWGEWIKTQTLIAAQLGGVEAPDWAFGWPTDPIYSHPIGGQCSEDTQCPSKICVEADAYCTRKCSEEAPCPDGYTCDATYDVCLLLPLGDVCAVDEDCVSEICQDGYCTHVCGPTTGCGDGYYCEDQTGLCTLQPIGQACSEDAQCAAGICHEGTCTRLCGANAPCDPGFECDPTLGICVEVPIGQECAADADCNGGICLEGLCTRGCEGDSTCPDGYLCSEAGLCELIAVGLECAQDADCASGICTDGFCTRECSGEAPCPAGYLCDAIGLCVMIEVGGECAVHEDCAGGLCLDGACTRECGDDQPCPEGYICGESTFVCEMIAGEELAMEDTVSEDDDPLAGCQHSGTSPGATPLLFLLGVVALTLWRRRVLN